MQLLYQTWVGLYLGKRKGNISRWSFDPVSQDEENPRTAAGVTQFIRDRIGRSGRALTTEIFGDYEVILTLHKEDGDPVMIGWLVVKDQEQYWERTTDPFKDITDVVVPWIRRNQNAFS